MRHLAWAMPLLAALLAAFPALAQSPALRHAEQETARLRGAGDDAQAQGWARQAIGLAQQEFGATSPKFAAVIDVLADLYADDGRYDEAEPLDRRALAIREKALGPNHPEVAATLNSLGLVLAHQGRYDDAEPVFKRALTIREKALGPAHPAVATSLNNLAEAYDHQGRYPEAEPLYRRALAIRERALGPDHPDVAATLNNLAALSIEQGRNDSAEPLLTRALEIREKAFGPNDPQVAESFANLASLKYRQGRYPEAEQLLQRAIAINDAALGPDNVDGAVTIGSLASLYEEEGRYAEAEPLFRRALAMREKALGPGHPDVAASLDGLAGLLADQGHFADAEPLYKRALAIREKALGPDHPDVADTLSNLAGLYDDQARYGEAEPLYRRALTILEKALGPDHPDVASILDNLAGLYDDEGRDSDAEPLYQRALAIRQANFGPDHPDVATSLNNLAGFYEGQGRYGDAEKLARRALAITEKALGADAPLVTTGEHNLARIEKDLGRNGDAEQLFRQALAVREKALGLEHPDVAATLGELARLYDDEGRHGEAEPLYRRALAIDEKALGPDHPDVATTLNRLAFNLVDQRHYTDALAPLERAAAIAAGRAADGQQRGKGQRSELRSNRSVFIEDLGLTAHMLANRIGDPAKLREEGFAALQWSKASDTAAAVAQMAARFAAGSDPLAALVRARQDAGDQLGVIEARLLAAASKVPAQRDAAMEARLRDQAQALRQELTRQDGELATRFPGYAELANPRPIGIAALQQLLKPDEALIAFVLAEPESYVVAVGHDSYEVRIVAVGAKAVAGSVRILRGSLDPAGQTDVPPFEAGTAYQLYQQLVAPVEASLKGIRQLYIVPDGALESLPLAVLLTAPPGAETLSESAELRAAPWFMRRYAVSVLPSISSLQALRQFAQASRASRPFFGIGDPLLKDHPPTGATGRGGAALALAPAVAIQAVFRGGAVDVAQLHDLPSLPETAPELEAEARLFKVGPGNLLLREAATVTAVKRADLADRRIIAFATHGLLAGDVGAAEPGLVMTPPARPSPEDDGLLKASEIAQLKLNADLVILSACNTAASDGTPGAEGFSGLSKAFLYAGARSLLVSHWEVVSGSTQALMTAMSRHLEEPGIGRAEALRLSMLELMQDDANPGFAHPLFWAPFVVVGEGGASAPPAH